MISPLEQTLFSISSLFGSALVPEVKNDLTSLQISSEGGGGGDLFDKWSCWDFPTLSPRLFSSRPSARTYDTASFFILSFPSRPAMQIYAADNIKIFSYSIPYWQISPRVLQQKSGGDLFFFICIKNISGKQNLQYSRLGNRITSVSEMCTLWPNYRRDLLSTSFQAF